MVSALDIQPRLFEQTQQDDIVVQDDAHIVRYKQQFL